MSFLTRKSKPKRLQLTETVLTESVGEDRINDEQGVISNVKVLGRSSENKREYSDRAMQDACRLYEGCEVNMNHPPRANAAAERGMIEGWGILKQCRVGSDGVYADLHYLREHTETPLVIERIKRGFPIGLSHNAMGNAVHRSGKLIVESVDKVRSVDMVRKPATNVNLFESEDEMKTTTLRELIESTGYKHTVKLLEMLPDEVDPTATMEMPAAEEGADVDAAQAVVETLADEAAKIIADPSIDDGDTLTKVKGLLKTVANVKKDLSPTAEEPADSDSESEEGEEKEVTESIQEVVKKTIAPLVQLVENTQLEVTKQKLLAEHGVNLSSLREDVRADLGKQTTEKGVLDLIESLPPAYRGHRPPRVSPSNVSQEDAAKSHVPLIRSPRR